MSLMVCCLSSRSTASTNYQALCIPLEARQINAEFWHGIARSILNELYLLFVLVEDFNVDTQALQLFDQHFESRRNPRLYHILTFHNRFVRLDTPHIIV